ncbi:MAG: cytochrome-c peroxidase [Armatimonadota bacterium]
MLNQRHWISGTLLAGLIVTGAAALSVTRASAQQASAPPKAPLGLPPVPWPADNPYSAEKAELGRLLYFDPRLSSDQSVSCASCHAPEFAYTDGKPVSTGIGGQTGGRSAPTVINRAYSTLQFWDGRSPSLEDQAKGPIANSIEMTSHKDAAAAHKACVDCLKGIPGYVQRFKKVFGTEDFDIDHVAKAIATFERTVLSGNAPFDRYKAGDKKAMTAAQVRGMDVFFGKAACDSCHIGFNFTDGSFENIGIGMDKPSPDLGRYMVTRREDEKGAFKTPTLRDVARTAPYMHDGSLKTLEEVVEHYNKGGIPNPWLDERMKPLNLTTQEKADLVEFLKALNGDGWQKLQAPKTLPQ